MGNRIFGTPKKEEPPISSVKKSGQSLQEQIAVLEKRKVYLTTLISYNDKKAKESTTKEDTYRYLKLKVMYANELKTVYGMLDKLEGLNNARERLLVHKDMLLTTQQATAVLKQSTIDPMKVEDAMDEMREAIDTVNEVSEILSRTDPPSDDVQAEFDSLVQSPQQPQTSQPAIVSFPEVPTRVHETPVEKELRMLVAS